MNVIRVYLSQGKLCRVEVRHTHLPQPIISVRGKEPGLRGDSSFQFTSAVRALQVLLVRASIAKRGGGVSPQLVGGVQSLAASLDYALGRKPTWIREMFGVTTKGRLLLSELFARENPEQRQPGPVSVSLRSACLRTLDILVYVDGRRLESVRELQVLLESTDCEQRHRGVIYSNGERPTPQSSDTGLDEFSRHMRLGYREELSRSLRSIDIFTEASLQRAVEKIVTNESLKRRLGSRTHDYTPLARRISPSQRLGLSASEDIKIINDAGELCVAIPLVFAGTMGIFTYLKHWRGLSLRVQNHYLHAVELSAELAHGDIVKPPDLVMMGLGPAVTLAHSKMGADYKPFMLMPRGKINIVKQPGVKRLRRLHMLHESPSSPLFLFENLKRQFGISSEATHAEPDEWVRQFGADFENPDMAAEGGLLMFPFNYIASSILGGEEVAVPAGSIPAEYVLFAARWILENPALKRALESVIRDAWLELGASASLMDAVVERLLAEPVHMRTLTRAAGVFSRRAA